MRIIKSCSRCLALLDDNKCEFGYKRRKIEFDVYKPIVECPKPVSKKYYEKIKEMEKEILKNYWLVPMIGYK